MAEKPFTLHDYPSAIMHIDGDAFFTSVEQSLHPEWLGRPVVTGKERGIIACASYEAKDLGIKRGVNLYDAIKQCPDLIVLPSDYETYSLFSKRMFNVVRQYTPMVEESSIDEGFADLKGLRKFHHCSYEDLAKNIKADIQSQLGITISVGLSLSKGLAKLASKFRKPDGFTAVVGFHIHLFLDRHKLDDVWGFGPNTVALLEKQGLRTALDFARQTERWAERMLGKIGREIWHELRGESVYPVTIEEKSTFASISKCKTFTAPSSDRDFVWAKLLRNVESACIKLRRFNLCARTLVVALRRRDFSQVCLEAGLNRATSAPQEMAPLIHEMFDQLFEPGVEFRATMVFMTRLEDDRAEQYELFEDRLRIDKMRRAAAAIDAVNGRHGKHKLALGPALFLGRHAITSRDELPQRKTDLLPGETARQRLGLPKWKITV